MLPLGPWVDDAACAALGLDARPEQDGAVQALDREVVDRAGRLPLPLQKRMHPLHDLLQLPEPAGVVEVAHCAVPPFATAVAVMTS